jgi:DNA-binding NarL/FixJ family response regulator
MGETEQQLADRLRRSPHTVHTHVKRLYRRFNVSSRSELLARFIRRKASRAKTNGQAHPISHTRAESRAKD